VSSTQTRLSGNGMAVHLGSAGRQARVSKRLTRSARGVHLSAQPASFFVCGAEQKAAAASQRELSPRVAFASRRVVRCG
jgi:hypothetical protein